MSWASFLEGLNLVPQNEGARAGPSASAHYELRLGQQTLDQWAQTVFTSNTSDALPFSLPPAIPPELAAGLRDPETFDWATLFSASPALSDGSIIGSADEPASSSTGASGGSGDAKATARGGTSRGKGKSIRRVEKGGTRSITDADHDELPEEEKKRKNTEASARFRAKKKQRQTELNKTSAELREKVHELERQSASLKGENKWLRDLVSEKSGMDARLLHILRSHSAGGALGNK